MVIVQGATFVILDIRSSVAGTELSATLRRPPGRRTSLSQRAVLSLAAALKRSRPGVVIDVEGRVGRLRDLLVATAWPSESQARVLPERLRASVDDPLALTANCFLPWSHNATGLRLGALGEFEELRFAARCPTGIRGTPPQTDLLLSGSHGVAGVVTRVTEHLTTPKTRIAGGYDQQFREPHLAAWQELLAELRASPVAFQLVDAVALAKHAVGLSRTFPGQMINLVYLFWEPQDVGVHPVFAAHRKEVEALRQRVAASGVPILPMSVRELWTGWLQTNPGAGLRDHVTALDSRYSVAIGV